MLETWNHACLAVWDLLLGWSLRLPADVTLFLVAAASALVLVAVRLVATDQDLLRRAAHDKTRLADRIRQARREGERETVERLRRAASSVALKMFASEGRPLLLALLPVAMLATWCVLRIDRHPPRDGEPITLVAYTPVSAAGEVTHLVPADGISCERWVTAIEAVTDQGPPHGMARWTVRATASSKPHRLAIRFRGQTYEHELLVGQPIYAPAVVTHAGGLMTETQLRPVQLFGVVPGLAFLYFPPWLVGYLLITIPLVPLLKRVLRIH
jgi:uncharacterized membrane protein (DUF106 family)